LGVNPSNFSHAFANPVHFPTRPLSLAEFCLLTSVCEAWQWSRMQNNCCYSHSQPPTT